VNSLQYSVLLSAFLLLQCATSQQMTGGLVPVDEPDKYPTVIDTTVSSALPSLPPTEPTTNLPAADSAMPGSDTTWISLAEQAPQVDMTVRYRVQVFASGSLESVQKVVGQARAVQPESVRIITSGALYKVQIGNFTDRSAATEHRRRLRNLHWPDAWVVVHDPTAVKPEPAPPEKSADVAAFIIQVVASGRRDVALGMLRRLLADGYHDSFVLHEDNLWKVRTGAFATRTEADQHQALIAAQGYPDAWVLPLKTTP
jgi:cell division septation protein DedD